MPTSAASSNEGPNCGRSRGWMAPRVLRHMWIRSSAPAPMVLHNTHMPKGDGERQEIDPPAIDRLGDIQAPALVILGEHDPPDIRAIGELLMDGLPAARLVEMNDVGHFLIMEQPSEFTRLVLDFL